jgi:hypothetical protein
MKQRGAQDMTVHTKKSMRYVLMCVLLSMGAFICGHQYLYLFIANENQQINNNDMKNYPHIITSERENQRLYYGYGELRKILQRKGIDSAIAK